jgi:P63C domain
MDSNKKSSFTTEQYQRWAKESKANPLPRRSIDLGGKKVEVFALPGYEEFAGRYVYSGTSAATAAGKPDNSILRFLRSKSPLALRHKGFESDTFFVENSSKGIIAYSSQVVSSYWIYQLSKGNLSVMEIVSSLTSTSLDLLADAIFQIDRATQEYERLIRERLFTVEAVEYKLHFYSEYYSELYRIFQIKSEGRGKPGIFAKVTRDCFYALFPGNANDIFDERNPYRDWYNHQFFTGDGNKIFSQIMNSFLTFLRGCRPGDWNSFLVQYQNVYGHGFQCELSL